MLDHLFESLVTRDLRVYSLPLQGKVYHYRDKSGLEIDNIISLDDNRWAAFQIRLSSSDLDETATSLMKLNDKLDPSYKKPSFLAIIYGGSLSYQRTDGVYVISIGSLKD
jgi:predicted AAA+ superfamily ATPase